MSGGRVKGSPKVGGRVKGTPNKAPTIFALLQELDYDPHRELAKIARIATENGDFNLAAVCAKELSKYYRPQLKAIDHSGEINGNHNHSIEIVFVNQEVNICQPK